MKCSASLAFYLFSPTRLINSIKHEHSCKILYLHRALCSIGSILCIYRCHIIRRGTKVGKMLTLAPERHLRNEFNFWNVHEIMNTSGLVQSKWSPERASLTLHETRSIHDSCTFQKLNSFLIFTFYIISQVSVFNFHLTWLVFKIFWIKSDIT